MNYWSKNMTNGWTPERRAKQSALIQTWRPWNSSTGAKTAQGKAVSSKNAYKGGLRALMKEIRVTLKQQRQLL
jgi:hypothetical protein